MSLKININVDEIAKQCNDAKEEIKEAIEKEVQRLATQTHTHTIEMAKQKLKTTRELFEQNCTHEEPSPGLHIISILEPAMFIEEGFKTPFDMKPGLLGSDKAYTDEKSGFKYLNVPFKHSNAPSGMTPKGLDIRERLLQKLDEENKKRARVNQGKIPFMRPLELNADKTPKLGRLHTFDWGGQYPTAKSNTRDLERVTVYQSLDRATGKVRRDWFTFRTVTNNPKYQHKWIRPASEGQHFLEEAERWFLEKWEGEVLPQLLTKYKDK